MPVVIARFLFYCAVLLFFANLAFGDGSYQHTKDGKTLVWNDYPHPGDTAIWSGYRDRDGYATGFGTLSWYTLQDEESTQPVLYARYFGRMVRGRFSGPVNVHLNDRTTEHALFIDGQRATRWAVGPTRSWKIPPLQSERRETVRIARSRAVQPKVPAEGPRPVATPPVPEVSGETAGIARSRAVQPEVPAEGPPSVAIPPTPEISSEPPSNNRFADDVDDSLRILAFPPATLRPRRLAGALPNEVKRQGAPLSSAAHAHLTREEVIRLADAQARADGYDPDRYERSEPQYDRMNGAWSLFYEKKPSIGEAETGEQFAVAVDDRTKKTAIAPAR
jgi:hypothetical protein